MYWPFLISAVNAQPHRPQVTSPAKGFSIPAQRQLLREYAQREGRHVAQEFAGAFGTPERDEIHPLVDAQRIFTQPLLDLIDSGAIPAPNFDLTAAHRLATTEVFVLAGYRDEAVDYRTSIAPADNDMSCVPATMFRRACSLSRRRHDIVRRRASRNTERSDRVAMAFMMETCPSFLRVILTVS
jgi:hypothetical protein